MRMLNTVSFIAFLIFVVVILTANAGDRIWTDTRIAETKAIGDRIVNALEKYRGDNGAYPQNLAALIPKYLGTIEMPSAGKGKWEYNGSSTFYNLGFYSNDTHPKYFGRCATSVDWTYDSGEL